MHPGLVFGGRFSINLGCTAIQEGMMQELFTSLIRRVKPDVTGDTAAC